MKMPKTLTEQARLAGGAAAALGGGSLLLDGVDNEPSPHGTPIAGALLGAGAGALLGTSSKSLQKMAKDRALANPDVVAKQAPMTAAQQQQKAALDAIRQARQNATTAQKKHDSLSNSDLQSKRSREKHEAEHAALMQKQQDGSLTSGEKKRLRSLEGKMRLYAENALTRDASIADVLKQKNEAELARKAVVTDGLARRAAAQQAGQDYRGALAGATDRNNIQNALALGLMGGVAGGVGGTFYDNPF